MISLRLYVAILVTTGLAVIPLYTVGVYAQTDCYTRFVYHWHIVNPVLECFEDRLDSGGGGGEVNTASNLGDGDGVFAQKVGVDLQFKSLEDGTGISLSSNANEITITSTVIDTNNCTSTGTGEAVCESANNINSLIAGTGISITDTSGDLTIVNTAPCTLLCIGEDQTVCSNTGTGNGLCNGGNVNIKSLIAGSGITIQDTTDDYTISSSSGNNALLDGSVHTDTVAQTVSKGSLVYGNNTPAWDELVIGAEGTSLFSNNSGQIEWGYGTGKVQTVGSGSSTINKETTLVVCQVGGLTGTLNLPNMGTGDNKHIIVWKLDATPNTGTCTLDPDGTDLIDGQSTYSMYADDSIIHIFSGGDDWYIVSNSPVAKVQGTLYQSVTKTNIGNAYVDVYTSAFDEEDMMLIDCSNISQLRIVYIWDYVGAGTQQIRWVDANNNSNVLYESPTFTADRDATDSGWFAKPSWCTLSFTIEQQGKSTTAGDDPVAKGYVIYAR